jgi:hypothetical protein
MIIRKTQIAAFERVAIENYVVELAEHCRQYSPYLCRTLREEELNAAIREGIDRAEDQGFTQRGPVRLYVDLMIVLGSGFDSDPQYPWAGEILRTREGSQMERAEALHTRTVAYLGKVDGPSNAYTLKALADLAACCRSGMTFQPETAQQDTLRLMKEIHPRKVEETGEDALRLLISDGTIRGQTQYGFRDARSLVLMTVLMFAFGHHFDRDPLLPWISRTLARIDPADPETAANKLERRALVWLDAVLQNSEFEQ